MFNNNCEEDFDFNLDDVVKINNTSSIQQSHSLVELSNPSTNVLLSKSKCLPDDWGSDDESHFLEIQLPKCSKHDDSQSLVIGSNKEVCDIKKNDQFVTGGNLNKDTVMEIQVRKFPGPAGVLLPLCNQTSSSKSMAQQAEKRKRKLEDDVDGLNGWDEALKLLNLTQAWNQKKINIQWIKRKFASGAIYLVSPILIVGIKSIQYTQGDAVCVLQDPTGETGGTIHQLVLDDYGKLLKTGSILLLRRPAILTSAPVHSMVTITKTCLFGIYSSSETSLNQITQCHKYDRKDLQAWLLESVVSGEPLSGEVDSSLISVPPQPLFSGNQTPYRSSSSAFPNKTPLLNPMPKLVSKPHVKPSNPNGFQSNPSVSVTKTASNIADSAGADDQFLSQLLDGVDTDSLFDDF